MADRPERRGRRQPLPADGRAARDQSGGARRGRRSGLALLRRHHDVAVEGRAVFDREAAHPDVAVEPAGAAERQALAGRDVAGDLAADAYVGALDGRLDGGARVDGHVPARLQVTLDVPGDFQVALDLEAALQDVARAEADDVGSAVLCRLNSGLFSLSHAILQRVIGSNWISGS